MTFPLCVSPGTSTPCTWECKAVGMATRVSVISTGVWCSRALTSTCCGCLRLSWRARLSSCCSSASWSTATTYCPYRVRQHTHIQRFPRWAQEMHMLNEKCWERERGQNSCAIVLWSSWLIHMATPEKTFACDELNKTFNTLLCVQWHMTWLLGKKAAVGIIWKYKI